MVANLDITAIFALVSEVSNGGDSPVSDAVHAWAALKPQHAACLLAETESPLRLADTLGRAVRADIIKTRLESTYGFSAQDHNIKNCFSLLPSFSACAAKAWGIRKDNRASHRHRAL